MNKNTFINYTFKSMCGLLLATNGLQASDVEANKSQEERVQIANSTLSRSEEIRLERKYATPEFEKSNSAEIKKELNSTEVASKEEKEKFDLNQQVGRHQGVFQNIDMISDGMVILGDGSAWDVYSGDRYKLNRMYPGIDKLIILQNNSWFFDTYKYRLLNNNTGDILEANLRVGPLVDRVRTIVSIDSYSRTIQLSDGSVFAVSSWDDFIYFDRSYSDMSQRRWLPTDAIIIGANDDFWGALTCPFILINVNVNKYAQAQLLN